MSNIQNDSQKYEDEIDLRELIMVLWKRKFIIIGITLIFAVLAGVFSKVLVDPVYETKFNIVVNIPEVYATKYGEYTLPITSKNDYINLIKNNDVIANTIEDMEYGSDAVSVEGLKGRIAVNNSGSGDQSVFQVTVSANNPEESLKLAQHLYANYINFLDIMVKERAVNYFYNEFMVKIKANENLILSTQDILARNEELLESTPEIINHKAAMEEIPSGVYVVIDNIINPNYTKIESDILSNRQTINELEGINAGYTRYLEELAAEEEAITKYYESGQKGKLESEIIDIIEADIYRLSEPVAPSGKASPNIKRNVVIGGVLGGMASVMGALFVAYWKKEI